MQKDLSNLKLLSIVLPAKDEEGCIAATVEHLHVELKLHEVPHEIIVVDDNASDDSTWAILEALKSKIPKLTPIQNNGPHAFGRAMIYGLEVMNDDAVVIMMADDVRDVVKYWQLLNEDWDCVFGSRFMKGGGVIDWLKLKVNRLANLFIRLLFNIKLNDTTNAFKAYRKPVIDHCKPFLLPHFNLTVEISLKAIVRGF